MTEEHERLTMQSSPQLAREVLMEKLRENREELEDFLEEQRADVTADVLIAFLEENAFFVQRFTERQWSFETEKRWKRTGGTTKLVLEETTLQTLSFLFGEAELFLLEKKSFFEKSGLTKKEVKRVRDHVELLLAFFRRSDFDWTV